jgi:anti-sigma-K factor RskA
MSGTMSEVGNMDWEHGGDDAVAAEYVLGVLPADERRAVAARIETEPDFARLVDRWEVRLAPMGNAYEEVTPPASIKQALDRRLNSASDAPRRAGLWESLAFWRGLTAAALAGVLLLAVLPYVAPPQPTQGERLVASLAPQESDVHYFVVYDERSRDIGLSHVTGARPDTRDFELWVIEEGQAPVSAGVIPVGSSVHLAVTEELQRRIDAGAVFAISLEPQGGSPTGQPTGPVVAAGDLRAI